ncbi:MULTISPECIES: hypothetical protein [unclassified Pedobacter]|nr:MULTISPECIES: hypothetical protein [unclassified Pedobacter]
MIKIAVKKLNQALFHKQELSADESDLIFDETPNIQMLFFCKEF